MSPGKSTQFRKGQSGNPAGRPKARRPNVSAFDIVFDKTLTVTEGGVEREMSVDEALELQTYQAALKGSKMAIRQVLKWIVKREAALTKLNPPKLPGMKIEHEHDADNADEAMRILGIGDYDKPLPGAKAARGRFKLQTWATQAALSRAGRPRLSENDVRDIKIVTFEADQLKWPKARKQ